MTRYLLADERREAVPLSDTTIWRMEKAGLFPKRVKLGPNRVGWREDEVEAWLADPQGWSLTREIA